MEPKEIKTLFEEEKALLSGHFLLSSGLHSDTYFQSALIMQYPELAEMLAIEIAKKLESLKSSIDLVISPALGGIIIGYELGRVLDKRAIFCERVDCKLTLRRGFNILQHENCLLVEDVITTGKSTNEVIEVVKSTGSKVIGVASLVDRSGGKADFGVPKFSLLEIELKCYTPEECPMCKKGIPFVKPGSRK
ncbi:MAG: orotate phosphoribosyltransferase [Elusimicrobia bacterium]|nr:orotate phosphoribosyltransferase [Candidatus Liberimonas magnetica]